MTLTAPQDVLYRKASHVGKKGRDCHYKGLATTLPELTQSPWETVSEASYLDKRQQARERGLRESEKEEKRKATALTRKENAKVF